MSERKPTKDELAIAEGFAAMLAGTPEGPEKDELARGLAQIQELFANSPVNDPVESRRMHQRYLERERQQEALRRANQPRRF